jgi:hypothetical protein
MIKKLNKNQLGIIGHAELLIFVVIIFGVSFAGLRVYQHISDKDSNPDADAATQIVRAHGIQIEPLSREKTMKTWRDTKLYNLRNMTVAKNLSKGVKFVTNKKAYKGGGFFYLDKSAYKQGKYYGVYMNRAFEVRSDGRAVFNGVVVPQINNMPLTSQRTTGGECTASRVWHSGLKTPMVSAIQKVQLHLGRTVPFTTAHRTYSEQACLWEKYNHDRSRVAPPGQSNHNRGTAVDVDTNFARTNAQTFRDYGLCRPVAGEDWHFEPC